MWGNTPTLLTPPTKEGETNIYKDPTQHTCVTKYQIQIPKAKKYQYKYRLSDTDILSRLKPRPN